MSEFDLRVLIKQIKDLQREVESLKATIKNMGKRL